MKVVVVARHPEGGIRTYFAYVYGNQVMEELDITLLTPETSSGQLYHDRIKPPFAHIQTQPSLLKMFIAVWRLIRDRKPDLIHSHGFTAAIVAAIPARLASLPHIVTTHDVFLSSQFKGIKGAIKHWLIGRVLRLPTCINPVGHDASDNLLSNYPSLSRKTNVTPIRNGIETELFAGERVRNLCEEVGLDDNITLLGFFGRFMAQKGFRMLIDAVEQLNTHAEAPQVHVVCFGWGGYIREDQADIKRRALNKYFTFFDGTDDMPAALRGVDAAVMPSQWEACPLLPMEAMVAGVPVISSDCIGMREVVRDTPAQVFEQRSLSGLIQALETFIRNKETFKYKAKEFRSTAAERFDVDNTASKLKELYELII